MKIIADTYRISPRRVLHPGCKIKVTGERGTFKYRCASVSIEGNVSIHVYGEQGFRAFRPERIKVVREKGGRR